MASCTDIEVLFKRTKNKAIPTRREIIGLAPACPGTVKKPEASWTIITCIKTVNMVMR